MNFQNIYNAAIKKDDSVLRGMMELVPINDHKKDGPYCWTAISQLAFEGKFEEAEFLLNYGADINLLIYGAALGKHIDYVQNLLLNVREGVNINFAIRGAAQAGSPEAMNFVETLLTQGGDVDVKEAIKFAAMSGNKENVATLTLMFASNDITEFSEETIIGAAAGGHKQYVEELLEITPWLRSIAVYGAALGGHKSYVEELLEDSKEETDLSLMMAVTGAAERNDTDYVENLLGRGADPSAAVIGAKNGKYISSDPKQQLIWLSSFSEKYIMIFIEQLKLAKPSIHVDEDCVNKAIAISQLRRGSDNNNSRLETITANNTNSDRRENFESQEGETTDVAKEDEPIAKVSKDNKIDKEEVASVTNSSMFWKDSKRKGQEEHEEEEQRDNKYSKKTN
ncbi:Ankyrin repeats (3 copies) [Legionella beliardensis]|uniref:Ankyrin repeats (3 copies) n=1 Tax=Legionella beliardensis TaxID=91822 RepID=A0A378I5Z7_9GAMM|nr:hypothetical protein [Legionella beliardensis]STX30180.1 Ankyrin repeats (3 copies) [Legionella beliardensis]